MEEVEIWAEHEVNIFLESSRNHRLYTAFHLAVVTGMRRSEILGLRWQDVGVNSLRIVQTITASRTEGIRQGGPKSEQGKRTVLLDGETLEHLAQWKQQQAAERTGLGSTWGSTDPKYQDLVFTTTLGTPIAPRGWDRIWQRLIKNAQVPKIKFHALRHFHGSFLLSKGFTEVEISERQGHSPKVFKSVYAHTFDKRRKSMAESLSDLGKPKL